MTRSRPIPKGSRIQGRLLEVTEAHRMPLFEEWPLPDGGVAVVPRGWLYTEAGSRGLALGSDGHHVTMLIGGAPRKVKRRHVRLIEE